MNNELGCAVPGLGPEVYAKWRASEIGAITENLETRLIRELAGDVRGCSVLDIGCGDGALRRRGWPPRAFAGRSIFLVGLPQPGS